MLQKIMQKMMPAQKMIEMFTFKISSNQSIEKIAERVPSECENNNFALLQTYVYHEIVESIVFQLNAKYLFMRYARQKQHR